MSRIHKKKINPKIAFFILSEIFFLLVALSIPVLVQISSEHVIDTSTIFSKFFFVWGLFGLAAGIGVALFGMVSLSEIILVWLIRILLILFIVLVFFMYITLIAYSN